MVKNNNPLVHVIQYIVLSILAITSMFPLIYIILASFRSNQELFTYALYISRD